MVNPNYQHILLPMKLLVNAKLSLAFHPAERSGERSGKRSERRGYGPISPVFLLLLVKYLNLLLMI